MNIERIIPQSNCKYKSISVKGDIHFVPLRPRVNRNLHRVATSSFRFSTHSVFLDTSLTLIIKLFWLADK